MARVLGLQQLLQKKYDYITLPSGIEESFGRLVENFLMIVWGNSGNGKSSFLMQFIKPLMDANIGKGLYVSLEEGFEASIQANVLRHLTDEYMGKIEFADYEMTYEKLCEKLSKRKSPKFIIIDSLQYWNINYDKYKALKELFPRKTFIFISHADGQHPSGTTAKQIRYDVPVKVRVEGYVAFVVSRFGGNKPFVIWEAGAKKHWGDKYNAIIKGVVEKKVKKKPEKIKDNEEANID